jgi:hypothetical protein
MRRTTKIVAVTALLGAAVLTVAPAADAATARGSAARSASHSCSITNPSRNAFSARCDPGPAFFIYRVRVTCTISAGSGIFAWTGYGEWAVPPDASVFDCGSGRGVRGAADIQFID